MNWDEVVRRHGSPAAINVKDGKVCSVLCGGAGHADTVYDDAVHYSIPKRPYYKRSLQVLEASAASGADFTVFCKLRQNEWADLGLFKVSSSQERQYDVVFELRRTTAR